MKEHYFEIDINECYIRGVLHEPDKSDRVDYIIIYCYGLIGDRVDCHRLAVEAGRFFAKNSIAFVRFDCRGTGTSDGNSINFGYYDYINDVKQVTDYFNAKYPNRKIVFLGISEGAIAATYLAQTYDGCNERLILWSPVYQKSKEKISSHENQDSNHPSRSSTVLHNKGLIRLKNTKKSSSTRGIADFGLWISISYFLERNKTSDLLTLEQIYDTICIYGTNDTRVTATILDFRNYDNINVIGIEGADHVFSHTKYKKELFNKTLDWLNN